MIVIGLLFLLCPWLKKSGEGASMFVVVVEDGVIWAAVRLLLGCSAGENCCWISPASGGCVAVSEFVVGSVFGRAVCKCSPTELVWSPVVPGAENPTKEEDRLDM